MNTQILYTYRDASNWKQHKIIVIEGKLNAADIELIIGKLEDGVWFLPEQVGLPRLQYKWEFQNEDDHIWHELLREDIELVDFPATIPLSAQDLINNFRKISSWDLETSTRTLWSEL